MKTLFAAIAAFTVVILSAGCSTRGPLTPGNILKGNPPKVRGIVVNMEASLVTVDFQPYDGRVEIEGWYMLPSDPEANRRRIFFNDDVIDGQNNLTGRAMFVIAGMEDWPSSSWNGSDLIPLGPGVKYFFMVTVRDHNEGTKTFVGVWEYKDGVLAQIS